jgi:hypothetical protein
MPYFEDFNLLFIHIPKTGGSNIENFFLQYLKKKPKINNLLSNNLNITINNHSLQHMTYQECYNNQNYFNINFDNIKILTVVRNPYNRIMSDIFYLKIANKNNTKEEIEQIIIKYLDSEHLYDNHKLQQYKFVINNNNEVNENIIIIKCEALNEQMDKLGFPNFKNFCKKTNTKENTNYMKYLTNNSLKKINEYYKLDFYYFNYNIINNI